MASSHPVDRLEAFPQGEAMHANILITGLEETLAAELSRALVQFRSTVISEPYLSADQCLDTIDRTAADLVFCTAESEAYEKLLRVMQLRHRKIPIVVVSCLPEIDKWLDALDAGAHDYCAAPFEPRFLRSIVENALNSPRETTLAC
jgi:DNA-binding NtrC family response regulator